MHAHAGVVDDVDLGAAGEIGRRQDGAGVHAAEEGPHIVIGRLAQDLLGGAHLDHVATFHDGNAVADADGLVEVVGDEDDGALVAGLQLDQFVLHLGTDQGVERGEGLVHEQDVGVVRQGAGEADALLHAARELVRIALRPLRQPDLFKRDHGALGACLLRFAGEHEAEGRVLHHAQVRHERKGLKHHAHVLAPKITQLGVGHARDVAAIDQHLAGGRFDQPVEQPHQGGFPRA